MPRNPNSPHNPGCGPIHTHTSASENIKLQMMMAKLEDSLKDEFVLKEQLKTINLESLLGSGNIDIKSIDRIEKASEGLVDTYTIYFNNAEPYSFTVTNGTKGDKGDPGTQGPQGEKGDTGEPGASGRDIELTKGDTHIQWRYVGETEWKNLIALESLKGAPGKDGQNGKDGINGNDGKDGKDGENGVNGRDIELNNDSEFLQWRYVGDSDSDWKQLIAVADLKGVDGNDGQDGANGKDGREVVITIINGNLVWFYKDEENDPTKHNFIVALTDLKGEKGKDGADGTAFTYDMLTPEQKAELKGEKGDQGIQGEKGDTGAAFTYDMFTSEQLEALKVKGDTGDKGDKGDAFTFEDFTPEQLDSLKVKGDKGDTGLQGPQGIQGPKGADGRGISNILPLDRVGLINTYSIYYTDGTVNTFTVTDGKDGEQGPQGVGIVDIVHDRDDIDGNCVYKIYLSDNTTREFTAYKGNDGAAPSIKVGELIYAPVDNIVTLPNFITEVPAEYITESELDSKGYLTEHQSLENYATKVYVTEAVAKAVTDGKVELDGYATETYVDEAVSKIEIPDVSKFITEIPAEYVTETELNNKGYLIESDLGDYAKKTDLFSKSYNDLTDKPAIPSIEGLATEDYVDNAIAAIDIPETDLTNYYDKEEVEGLIESIEHPKQTYYLDFTAAINGQSSTVPSDIVEAANQVIAGKQIAVYLRDDKITDSNLKNYGSGTVTLVNSDTFYQVIFGRIARSNTTAGGITANLEYEYKLLRSKTASDPTKFSQYNATYSRYEFVTKDYVTTAIKAIPANPKKVSELENDKGYITLSEVPETDLSNYYTKDETYTKSEVDALLPAVEQVKQAVLNEVSPEVESVKTTVQSELLPKIEEEIEPTVSELKTWVENKEYLQDIDLEGYATLTDLASKADNIPFKEDKYVTSPLGKFKAGDSVKGLSIAEILAKLLGLTDEIVPEEPDVPTGIIDTIVTENTPIYQVSEEGSLQLVDYEYIAYDEATAAELDGQTGFYQITNAEGKIIESGYQHCTTQKEMYYAVALPKSLVIGDGGNITLQNWDYGNNAWANADHSVLTDDQEEIRVAFEDAGLEAPVAPEGYILWADLSLADPGTDYRFIINE